jgi:small Trp-rich protein
MYLLGIGIILLAMKYLEFGPVAAWSWWIVLTPFALAVAWWAWADASGYTKRKATEKENARKQARIDKSR